MTPEHVAKKLTVAIQTLNNWRYEKKGPPWLKIEGNVRYPEDKFIQWVENHG